MQAKVILAAIYKLNQSNQSKSIKI